MMDKKLLITILIAINCYASCRAALRRTPRVYNALITTDENLSSSRAYPVIQPTIHETGVPHYPFGPYNPYGFYNPSLLRFGQPIAPGLLPREQLPYPLPPNQFPPQIIPGSPPSAPTGPATDFSGYPQSQQPPTAPGAELPQVPNPQQPQQSPVRPPTAPLPSSNPQGPPSYMPLEEYQNRGKQMPPEKLPIPLNEYGLPPALIPLQQYPNRRPVNLPPYDYNQYPLLYDPITGIRQPYLPPYEYFPGHTYAVGRGVGDNRYAGPQQPAQRPGVQTLATTPPPEIVSDHEQAAAASEDQNGTLATPPENFDSIKNASKSKNSDVPDVPPPPIPTGAKSRQK